jgi:hypothetical protein
VIIADFPGSNIVFRAPVDLDDSQVAPIRARVGRIHGGPLDGAEQVLVAWKPDAEDLARLQAGEPLYVSFLGGLPPHMVFTGLENGGDAKSK